MSGEGIPDLGPVEGAQRLRVAIVASRWHESVMTGLLAGARRAVREAGVQEVHELRVPGAFELTVAASRLVSGDDGRPWVDAVVALGVVIRGGTPHFDYVCQSVTAGLTALTERTGVPIGNGVLTCDTEQQALDRSGLPGSSEDKGYEAATAAMHTALELAAFEAARRAARQA